MSRALGRLNVLEQAVRAHDIELWAAVLPLQEWTSEAVEKIARTSLRSDNLMAWRYLQELPLAFPLPKADIGLAHESWWHLWALEGKSSAESAVAWCEALSEHLQGFDDLLEGGSSTPLGLALDKGCLHRASALLKHGADPTSLLRNQPLPLVLVNRLIQSDNDQSSKIYRLQFWSGYEGVTKIWSAPPFPLLARSVARWSEAFELMGRYYGVTKLQALQEVWTQCRVEQLMGLPAQTPPARPRM